MNTLRFYYRLFGIARCLGYGTLKIMLLFPFYRPERRLHAIQAWSKDVLRTCGLSLRVHGTPPPPHSGRLIAANHISWLDIMAVNAACPGRFVAKDDVARWPVIGYLATRADTIFVSRRRNHDGNQNKAATLTRALLDGQTVTLFPEGTTTVGDTVLPFKSSFFQAAVDAQASVQPLLCRYPDAAGRPDPDMAYYGDMSLWQSICNIIRRREGVVELYFLPPLPAGTDRRLLADTVQQQLQALHAEHNPAV